MRGSQWTVEVDPAREGTAECPAWSPAYRCAGFGEDDPPTTGFQTVHELWKGSYKVNRGHPCLGVRCKVDGGGPEERFVFKNYQEVHLLVASLAGSILGKLVVPGRDEEAKRKKLKGGKSLKSEKEAKRAAKGIHAGIFGANCPAWLITFFACARSGMVSVPLYETLGGDAIEYIIRHAELHVVFVAGNNVERIADATLKLDGNHCLKYVVFWSGNFPDWHSTRTKLAAVGVKMFDFNDLVEMGEAARFDARAPCPDDLCSIMYTSGSTGMPKGVMLSHKALVHNVACLSTFFDQHGIKPGFGDSILSYLPLAHIFDLTFELFFIYSGARIGYFGGDTKKLLSDAQLLKPTMFIGVPRILDKVYALAQSQLQSMSTLRRMIWSWGFSRKLAFLRAGIPVSKASPVFDMLCSSLVHNALGGKQRVVISGGASLSTVTEEFLRVTMRCPVIQGYGLTETTAGAFIAVPNVHEQLGTVGPPLPTTSVRLESVPEMGYDALGEPPVGEVLIKSKCNFSGYYKEDEMTKDVIEADGWFHTGDIGALKDNALKIVDRRKNIFKMSHGEYVAVEIIEMALKQSAVVDQIWVYGDGTKFDLIAVVVPSQTHLEDWAKLKGISGSYAELCTNPSAREYIHYHLTSQAKKAGLQRLEFIQAVHLESIPFSAQNGLLTPTFKARRKQLLERYQDVVNGLYSSLK